MNYFEKELREEFKGIVTGKKLLLLEALKKELNTRSIDEIPLDFLIQALAEIGVSLELFKEIVKGDR